MPAKDARRPDTPREDAFRKWSQVRQDLPKVLAAVEQPTDADRRRGSLEHLVQQVNEAISAVEQAGTDVTTSGPHDGPIPESVRRALHLSVRAINAVADTLHDEDASARIRSMAIGLEHFA